MPKKKLITIVTVVLNRVNDIEQTILSVINNGYQNIEYIIIDGGSVDGTVEIIRKYEKEINYWISENDSGIYSAINKGLTLASGESIGILNAGDRLISGALESVSRNENLSKIIIYGGLSFVDSNRKQIYSYMPPLTLKKLRKQMIVCHPSTFIGKEIYNFLGNYDETYQIAADYKLILKAYLQNVRFERTERILVEFLEGGISANFKFRNLTENMRLRRELKISQIVIKELIIYIYFRVKNIFRLLKKWVINRK
jgi:glycosyltransferase involved in cell wall biosynthesis